MKRIFVINGEAGCGKDTFVSLCKEVAGIDAVWNVSMVDRVKEIAKECGWDGQKTPESRKFLSDLKDLCDSYNDMSYREIVNMICDFLDDEDAKFLFIHAREPKDIDRICKAFGASSLLVKRVGYKTAASNHADANVYRYEYDYTVANPGTMEEYRDVATLFLHHIENEAEREATA